MRIVDVEYAYIKVAHNWLFDKKGYITRLGIEFILGGILMGGFVDL